MASGSKRLRIVLLLTLALCVALSYRVYLAFNPYNEVTTEIVGISPKIDFVCVVAETENGLTAMHWARAKVVPVSIHPNDLFSTMVEPTDEIRDKVHWINGRRAGVLARDRDGRWTASWFNQEQLQWHGRSILWGGGSVILEIGKAEDTQVIGPTELLAAGFDASRIKHSPP